MYKQILCETQNTYLGCQYRCLFPLPGLGAVVGAAEIAHFSLRKFTNNEQSAKSAHP